MERIQFIYWTGVAVSAIIALILTLVKHEIRLTDIISALFNIVVSWACPISLICIGIVNVLKATNRDPLIWKKKEDKNPKLIRTKK